MATGHPRWVESLLKAESCSSHSLVDINFLKGYTGFRTEFYNPALYDYVLLKSISSDGQSPQMREAWREQLSRLGLLIDLDNIDIGYFEAHGIEISDNEGNVISVQIGDIILCLERDLDIDKVEGYVQCYKAVHDLWYEVYRRLLDKNFVTASDLTLIGKTRQMLGMLDVMRKFLPDRVPVISIIHGIEEKCSNYIYENESDLTFQDTQGRAWEDFDHDPERTYWALEFLSI